MQRYAFASQFSQEASARNHCFPVERDFCFYGIARNWFIAGYECQIYVLQSVKSSRFRSLHGIAHGAGSIGISATSVWEELLQVCEPEGVPLRLRELSCGNGPATLINRLRSHA